MGALEKALNRFMEGGQGETRIQQLIEKRGGSFDPATSVITSASGRTAPVADFAQRIAQRAIAPSAPVPTVSDWQSQYGAAAGKQATGWKDPIAAEIGQKYFGGIEASRGGSLYDKYLNEAKMYESGKYGGYLSPLDPLKWGSGGYKFEPEMKADYIAAGGQAFNLPTLFNSIKNR